MTTIRISRKEIPLMEESHQKVVGMVHSILDEYFKNKHLQVVLGSQKENAERDSCTISGGDLVTFANPTSEPIEIEFLDTTVFELGGILVQPGGSPTLRVDPEVPVMEMTVDDNRKTPQFIIVNPPVERIANPPEK